MKKETIIRKNERENLVEKLFTTADIARILNTSEKTVYIRAVSIKIKPVKKINNKNYYSWKQMRMIKELNENCDGKASIYFKKHPVEDNVVKPIETMKAEHPLVHDERCFNFNWWPEVIPACFMDA